MLKASHSDSRMAPLTSFWDANRLLVWLLELFCKKLSLKLEGYRLQPTSQSTPVTLVSNAALNSVVMNR